MLNEGIVNEVYRHYEPPVIEYMCISTKSRSMTPGSQPAPTIELTITAAASSWLLVTYKARKPASILLTWSTLKKVAPACVYRQSLLTNDLYLHPSRMQSNNKLFYRRALLGAYSGEIVQRFRLIAASKG